MVIEFIEGTRVIDLIEQVAPDNTVSRRPLPLPAVLYIADQLLRAIQHFAELTVAGKRADLVHRDPTLMNIICGFAGEVKLIDFGIARAEVDFRNRTVAGGYKGNPHYSAPEQANGIPVEHRTDVFIVGVDIYEMLRGDRAFPGTQAQAIQAIRNGGVPAPLPADSTAPPALVELTQRMMNIDIAKRPTAKQARAVLRQIVAGLERKTGKQMLFEVGRDMVIGLVAMHNHGKLRRTSPNLGGAGAEVAQVFADMLPDEARRHIMRPPPAATALPALPDGELPATVRAPAPPSDTPRAPSTIPDDGSPSRTVVLPENYRAHTRRSRPRSDGSSSRGKVLAVAGLCVLAAAVAGTLLMSKLRAKAPAAPLGAAGAPASRRRPRRIAPHSPQGLSRAASTY